MFIVPSLERYVRQHSDFHSGHPKSEAEPLECSFEMMRSIDETRDLLNLVFLTEFTKQQYGELCGSGLK
jgi:hypothetical protein